MLAANGSIPRLVLSKVVVVGMVGATVCRSNDMEHILISLKQALSPENVSILAPTLHNFTCCQVRGLGECCQRL